MRGKLQIELLRVTVLRIKLFSEFSLNDHTESYAIMLIERDSVTMMMRRAGNELNTDTSAGRRNNISLQGMATFTAAVREAGEDMIMRAVLLQLIDITVFNLTFLTVMKAAAAS
ncbi:hypothetical protein BDDG_12621 [Blastomyces dermatitidis ATCC 18188]|uniref:Uncharacterized protein n=1 Tax=Ajellomyces dermatitidis (strain ATCC 18188 / CBS 674.68) TaxID=653446 RepID=A0A0J9ESM3_AJEDA|nr:hypothetical protein BDDG_12621 [Blastomyces dermatitidis ATCC 18188]